MRATTPSLARASVAAEAWMLAFALVHVYWVADGRALLPEGRSIYETPALVVIDVVAIPACLAGAALAHSLRTGPEGRPPARWRFLAVAAVAAVLVAHALPTVPTWVRLAFPGAPELSADERFVTFAYEPFFLLGGALCAWSAAAFRRLHPAATSRPRRREAPQALRERRA